MLSLGDNMALVPVDSLCVVARTPCMGSSQRSNRQRQLELVGYQQIQERTGRGSLHVEGAWESWEGGTESPHDQCELFTCMQLSRNR